MLKKIIFSSTLILNSAVFAAADFSGNGRVRYVRTDNKDFNKSKSDRASATGMRFRFNVKASGKKWNLLMQPQMTKSMGAPTGTSGALADSNVTAHQMYVNYKANDYFSLKAGRMEINLGDQLLIGAVGYSDTGRSFDGVVYNGKCLISGTNKIFGLKVLENGKANDTDVYGLYHSQKLFNIKNFDLYAINVNDKASTTGTTNYNTFGTRLKSNYTKVDYRIETSFQKGKTSGKTINENQFDIEVGYKLNFKGARIAFEYFQASKNFNQLYPTGHKWLGHADMFARKNIKGLVAHYSMKICKESKLISSFHMFSRTDTTIGSYKFNNQDTYGTTGTESAIANELDLAVKSNLDKDLNFTVGYSLVMPAKYLKAQALPDTMSYLYTELNARF